MTIARFLVGDSLTVLRGLPDASVDLVVTSPPFLALRSYLPPDHPEKAFEIGGEATPGEFIDALLDIVEECRRVLAPHGSLCFELGDTYSGSGGAGGDYTEGGLRDGQERFDGSASRAYGTGAAPRPARNGRRSRAADEADGILAARGRPGPQGRDSVEGWPLDKSLCLIPESFRWALVYGRNPFTGRTTEPWRARNVVRWCRPNPPVGALGDKWRPGTSDIVVACASKTRFFDGDATRTPSDYDRPNLKGRGAITDVPGKRHNASDHTTNPAGAPLLDWWKIPTKPYAGSHYAVMAPALLEPIVKAMCPSRVCMTCGEPSRRIVASEPVEGRVRRVGESSASRGINGGDSGNPDKTRYETTTVTTLGWSDCGHNTWRTGIVLDPFAGSGTTLAVATGHGRDAIGIDLDERNLHLARERVGMFLEDVPA